MPAFGGEGVLGMVACRPYLNLHARSRRARTVLFRPSQESALSGSAISASSVMRATSAGKRRHSKATLG
jgi:hypothetical protein